jgi:hypothetical protein
MKILSFLLGVQQYKSHGSVIEILFPCAFLYTLKKDEINIYVVKSETKGALCLPMYMLFKLLQILARAVFEPVDD